MRSEFFKPQTLAPSCRAICLTCLLALTPLLSMAEEKPNLDWPKLAAYEKPMTKSRRKRLAQSRSFLWVTPSPNFGRLLFGTIVG